MEMGFLWGGKAKGLLSPALSSNYRWKRGRWKPVSVVRICESVGCLDQGS
jgi:hypothetical protein